MKVQSHIHGGNGVGGGLTLFAHGQLGYDTRLMAPKVVKHRESKNMFGIFYLNPAFLNLKTKFE